MIWITFAAGADKDDVGGCSDCASEPQVGFEPTTARLRIECSTPELLWPINTAGAHGGAPPNRMPWRGFEPRRLSALPPQDSVSTSFTTRARGAAR